MVCGTYILYDFTITTFLYLPNQYFFNFVFFIHIFIFLSMELHQDVWKPGRYAIYNSHFAKWCIPLIALTQQMMNFVVL